jgi:hypothetical protein
VQKWLICNAFREYGNNLPMQHGIEKLGEIEVRNPVDWLRHHFLVKLTQDVVTAPPWSASVRRVKECQFVDRFQDSACQFLDDLIFHATDAQGTHTAVFFGNLDPAYRLGPVRHLVQLSVESLEVGFQVLHIHLFDNPSSLGAFVPSSASKHASKLPTLKCCITAV